MDDGIPENKHANAPKQEMPIDEQISELVRDGIRLGMRLAKAQQENASLAADDTKGKENDDEEVRMDFLSPRFLSITEGNSDAKVQYEILYKNIQFREVFIPLQCFRSTPKDKGWNGT